MLLFTAAFRFSGAAQLCASILTPLAPYTSTLTVRLLLWVLLVVLVFSFLGCCVDALFQFVLHRLGFRVIPASRGSYLVQQPRGEGNAANKFVIRHIPTDTVVHTAESLDDVERWITNQSARS